MPLADAQIQQRVSRQLNFYNNLSEKTTQNCTTAPTGGNWRPYVSRLSPAPAGSHPRHLKWDCENGISDPAPRVILELGGRQPGRGLSPRVARTNRRMMCWQNRLVASSARQLVDSAAQVRDWKRTLRIAGERFPRITCPPQRSEKETRNARNKNRREVHQNARNQGESQVAWNYSGEDEEGGSHPRYPNGRKLHAVFRKIRGPVLRGRVLFHEGLSQNQPVESACPYCSILWSS